MPAAIAVPAVAGLIGGGINAAMQNKAANQAQQAQQQALQFEQQKEADRKAQYQQAMKLYVQQMNAWNASHAALARRYGINVPAPKQITLADLLAPSASPGAIPRPIGGGGGGGGFGMALLGAGLGAGGALAASKFGGAPAGPAPFVGPTDAELGYNPYAASAGPQFPEFGGPPSSMIQTPQPPPDTGGYGGDF